MSCCDVTNWHHFDVTVLSFIVTLTKDDVTFVTRLSLNICILHINNVIQLHENLVHNVYSNEFNAVGTLNGQ